jgi:biopolymer transport protein ExbD
MSLRDRTIASPNDDEVLAINLTPMIDVVFQLIIFFMCAMKFKTLEEKLKLDLPEKWGIEPSPARLPPPMSIAVRVRQTPEQGVPRIFLMNEEIRPELGSGVGAPPRIPAGGGREAREAALERQKAHWARYVAPKLARLEEKLRHCVSVVSEDMRYEVDAAETVRHECAVGVIDTLVAAGIKNIHIRGATPPRSGR